MGTVEKINSGGAAGAKAKTATRPARRPVTPSPPAAAEKLWVVGGFAMSRKLATQIAAFARQRPKVDPEQT